MQMSALKQLRQEMEQLQLSWQLDGYGLFVYCVELRRLHLPELAIPALCEAVRLKPAHWGAWLELSCRVSSKDRLTGLDICRTTGGKQVFLAHTYLKLQQNKQAVKIYDGISAVGGKHLPILGPGGKQFFRSSLFHILRFTHTC